MVGTRRRRVPAFSSQNSVTSLGKACFHWKIVPHKPEEIMDFMKLFQSLENAVYEIVTWVMFLPKTIFYTIIKPARMMEYVTEEWKKEEKDRFDDFLSPVILWLLVVVIPMLTIPFLNPLSELAIMFQMGNVDISAIKTEQQALFITLYALLVPVAGLVWLEWRNKDPLRKSSLKRNFYQQCYAIAPAQFLYLPIGIAFWMFLGEKGFVLANVALPWFYQIFFFRSELETINKNWWKAALHAVMPQVIIFVAALIFFIVFGVISSVLAAV
jgi:uncharacterized membrane protein YfbV (UPF0208 family)